MVSCLRRALAKAVASALVVASPGIAPYQALAAFSSGKAGRAPAKVVPHVPAVFPQAFPDSKNTSLKTGLPASVVVSLQTAGIPASAQTAPTSAIFHGTARVAAEAVATLARPDVTAAVAYEAGKKLAGETGRSRGEVSETVVDASAAVLAAPTTLAKAPSSAFVKRGAKIAAPSHASGIGRLASWALRTIRAAVVAGLLIFGPGAAIVAAQDANPPPPGIPTVPAAAAATGQAQEKRVIAAPVTIGVAIERQGVTVGDRVQVTVTIKNDGPEPLRTAGLRTAFNDAIHQNLEIQQGPGDEPVTIAPGETKTFVFELRAWDSGDFQLSGSMTILMEDAQGVVVEAEARIPPTPFAVKTVLAKDWEEFKKGEWKKKGFRDIAGAQRPETGLWTWLLTFPLLILLLVGAERLIAARNRYPRLTPQRLGAVALAQKRLDELAAKTGLPTSQFYHELYAALSSFIADFHALPTRERPAETLIRDASAANILGTGQLKVLSDLARRAAAFEFDPGKAERGAAAAQRAADLEIFRDLIEHMARGKAAAKASGPALGGFALLAGGWTLANPLALLLFIPLIAHAIWSKVRHSRRATYQVSSLAAVPSHKSLRQRFLWVPHLLRSLAISIAILIAAHPQLGIVRQDTVTESTDTVPVLDISGSMSGWKLESAKAALKDYIEEQRRTSDNRVGLVTFSDQAYLDYRLDQGYDALIAQIKQLSTRGSTAVGDALLKGVAHFLEVNILELDDSSDARLKELRDILLDQGVPAALEYLGRNPDLKPRVLQPERKKIVILFSDGDSNSGQTHPTEAAFIAKALGVKIYTIGIGADVGGYDEKTLRDVAAITDAHYVKVTDAAGMVRVLNEIAAAEKSPTKIVASLSIKDYQKELSIAALLLLLASLGFYGAGLRVLRGGVLLPLGLAASLALPPQLPLLPEVVNDVKPVAQERALIESFSRQFQSRSHGRAAEGTVQPFDPSGALELRGMPAEVLEANRLYNRGRYEDALKAYARALERYPDLAAIHFNMADAYLRIGAAADPADPEYLDRAQKAYERYLALEQDSALQSRALYNLGNLSLIRRKAEEALEFYKEALRRFADNQDAKWNLEYLQKMLQEQQQQQQDQQQDQSGKKKGKKQKGEPGQKGQKGERQPGEPGNREGEPEEGEPGQAKAGDRQGQGQPADKDAAKDPLQRLGEKLGEAEKSQEDAQRGAVQKKGHGQWGGLALPLAAAGTGLTFTAPAWVWAAAVIVPLVVLVMSFVLYRQLQAARALSPATAPKNAREWWGIRRWWVKTLAIAGAAGFLSLAAGNPQMGVRQDRLNFGGNKDLFVVADVSYSTVYAKDGRRQKIERDLSAFVESLRGADRIGLVVFAGEARTKAGLDVRYANFQYHIGNLERVSRGLKPGSNLAAAVKHAVEGFEAAKKIEGRRRVLIVVSDGDIHGQDLKETIELAKRKEITIYTIGVGTPIVLGPQGEYISGGATMEAADSTGKMEPIIDEKTGQPARTGLIEGPLRELAHATGGEYFASAHTSMKEIMAKVARLEQGEQGDVVLSPQSVAAYPAGVALLLLLLGAGLPGASLLRRPEGPAKPAFGKKGGRRYSAGALLGLGALSVGAWPALLAAGLGLAALAALVLFDYWTGGAFSKRVVWALQKRSKTVETGVVRDAGILFEVREADRRALEDFARGWDEAGRQGAAGESRRRRLIADAAQDEQLWREKLVLAYLYGATPAGQSALLAALRQTGRRSFKPLAPVVLALHARRGTLAWLDHPEALRRLMELSLSWLDASDEAARAAVRGLVRHVDDGVALPAARFLGEKRLAARTWTRLSKLTAGALVVVLIAALGLAGAAGPGTLRYLDQRAQEQEASLRIFYGDDMRMFSDRYVDERIPTEVLPAFREWHHPRGERALERAIAILAKSADPKADNLLEAAFKNADVMPLSPTAEAALLKALLLRENDEVWKFMLAHMERSAGSEKLAARLMRMVDLAMTLGEERYFQHSFYFLHSPNPAVRQHALEAIYKSLVEKDKGQDFYRRLAAAQARFASDPLINLQIMTLALRRLGESAPTLGQGPEARALIFKTLEAGQALAQARAQALAAAKPGQQVRLPPAYEWLALRQLAAALEAGQGQPAVVDMSRAALNKLVGDLAREAAGSLFLKDRLIASELGTNAWGYSAARGPYGPMGVYGSYGQQFDPLPVYKLDQIAAIRKIIEQVAQDPSTLKPGQLEFIDRAVKALTAIEEFGETAGMVKSDAPGVAAAAELNAVLDKAYSVFVNERYFVQLLRDKGLAPINGAVTGADRWRETYTKEQVLAIRKILEEVTARGGGWDSSGKPATSLSWNEREFLDSALAQLDAILAKHFPEPVQNPPPAAPGEQGQATAAEREKALWALVNTPGQESLALVRLVKAVGEADTYGPGFVVRAVGFILEQSRRGRGGLSGGDIVRILDAAYAKAPAAEAALDSALVSALANAKRYDAVAIAARKAIHKRVKALVDESVRAFGEGFNETLASKGVRIKTSYDGGDCDMCSGPYTNFSDPSEYTQAQLRDFLTAVEAEAVGRGKALTAEQRAVALKSRAEIVRLLPVAVAAGLWPGGTHAESLAETVRQVILPGHQIFYGQALLEAIAAKGVGDPENVLGTTGYTREDLVVLKGVFSGILASGKTMDGTGLRDLTVREREYLKKAISQIEALIAAYPAQSVLTPVTLPPAPALAPEAAPTKIPVRAPKAPKKAPRKHHGFALAAFLGLGLPSWIGLMVLAAVGVTLAWWLMRRFLRTSAPSLDRGEALATADALRGASRAKKMELAASRMADSWRVGGFRSRQLGPAGFEFGELREYQPGDDVRRINWRATAARPDGKLLVNRYEQQKDMPAFVILDLSASGRYGPSGSSKELVARELAAMTLLAAAEAGMRTGTLAGAESAELVEPLQSGRDHALVLARRLAVFKPAGRRTDLKALFERAARELPAGAQVFIVSDFISDTDYRTALAVLSRRHEVHAVRVVEPLERRPLSAAGELIEVEDLESGETRVYDARRFARDEEAALLEREAAVENAFDEARIDVVTISTEGAAEGRHLDAYADHFKPRKAQ